MQTRKKQTIQDYDFLPPEPGRRSAANVIVRKLEVEDAIFEVVSAQPQSFRRTNDNPPPQGTPGGYQLLPIAARMAGRLSATVEHQLARLSPQAFVALLSSLFLAVFWLLGGFSALNVAESAPPLLQPFTLGDMVITSEDANGMKIAAISGTVTNISPTTIPAPRLSITTSGGNETIGTIVLPVDRIGPDGTIRFSGRFKLAGGKSADIAIIPERR